MCSIEDKTFGYFQSFAERIFFVLVGKYLPMKRNRNLCGTGIKKWIMMSRAWMNPAETPEIHTYKDE